MAETKFWTAAFVAILSLCLTIGLAAYQTSNLEFTMSKTVCWIIPVGGAIAMAFVIYDAFFGYNGGNSIMALGVYSLALYALALAFIPVQFIFGLLARAADRS